jgi:2-hydroxy-3-keto-5-methylthiopentenyl-1-phosphate phosphatase
MDAIRNSDNHYSVLESFWKGQLESKEWLIANLQKFIPPDKTKIDVVIHGGWNGVLASLLYNSGMPINLVTSIDMDENCEEVANMINKRYEINDLFRAVTSDMCFYEYNKIPDIVINTSTEHLTRDKYKQWLEKIPKDCMVVLQNNNYYEIPEHVNCYNTVDDFAKHCELNTILLKDTLELPSYNRFLIIGYK